MTHLLAIPLVFAGCVLIAYGITAVLVEVLDLMHWCYSPEREQRREARIDAEYAQRHPRLPAGSYVPRGEAYVPIAAPLLRRILIANLRRTGP